MRVHRLIVSAVSLLLLVGAAAQQTTTQARLLLDVKAARPGDTVWAAIELTMAPEWHTYWRNPGESGMATAVGWKLPEGVTAGDLQWPVPEVYVAAGMTTYVYHDRVLLTVPLRLSSKLADGELSIQARVSWLECREACIPGGTEVSAVLTIGDLARASDSAPLISTWRGRVPTSNPALDARASWEQPPEGDEAPFLVEGSVLPDFSPTEFYAYPADNFAVNAGVEMGDAPEGAFALGKTVFLYAPELPTLIEGILVQTGAGAEPKAFEVALRIGEGDDSPPTAVIAGVGAPAAPMGGSLLPMLGLAFLGGLILNIMPCVLPVIALKILGFVQQSKEAPRRVRKLGLVYALGVLASFLILGGVVVVVKQAGGDASWGMQMQNTYFRLALLVIVFLVALNLFGVFEITLSSRAMGAASGLASKEGAAGAFFNGVLATALATPCTAPFLAVALGFAFTQSSGVILLMFATVGLGLAAPYVLLSWKTEWLKFLPKPGSWMLRFKVAMGFPMLATAVWLFDVTAPGFGSSGTLWLGLWFVLLGVVAWIFGEFIQRGTARKGLAVACCLALLGVGYLYVLEGKLRWRTPHLASADQGVIRDSPEGIAWFPWNEAAVEEARAAGRPVLVDFTAKWCLTCKANKAFAIDIDSVREKLRDLNAVAFRADYTDKDPRITQELHRYGRAGVPMVLVFPADSTQPAAVLPTALSPGMVLDALDQVAEASRTDWDDRGSSRGERAG